MFRSALCSPFAPAFRFRECHSIRPCIAQSLSLTEACLRENRLHGSEGGEGESPFRPLCSQRMLMFARPRLDIVEPLYIPVHLVPLSY